mmetsp:Transcript_49240/g.157503  ORF Transcript_49240/g.157503 Transcript_49240/m.157503 type:complete len:207 (-) Transcript_49240:1016-1636(-)
MTRTPVRQTSIIAMCLTTDDTSMARHQVRRGVSLSSSSCPVAELAARACSHGDPNAQMAAERSITMSSTVSAITKTRIITAPMNNVNSQESANQFFSAMPHCQMRTSELIMDSRFKFLTRGPNDSGRPPASIKVSGSKRMVKTGMCKPWMKSKAQAMVRHITRKRKPNLPRNRNTMGCVMSVFESSGNSGRRMKSVDTTEDTQNMQ